MSLSVCPLLRGNIKRILFIRPVADLWDPVSPLQGEECRFITPSQGAGLMGAVHGGWATYSSAFVIQTQHRQ
jgi:hypothetical protein